MKPYISYRYVIKMCSIDVMKTYAQQNTYQNKCQGSWLWWMFIMYGELNRGYQPNEWTYVKEDKTSVSQS